MPVEMGLWKANGSALTRLSKSALTNEELLRSWIVADPDLLGRDLLIIGREVITASRGRIDLLAIDSDGVLHVIELKRNMTPREVVAQALDYASCVADLTAEQVDEICRAFRHLDLPTAFQDKFATALPELNGEHSITIVAPALDDSSERIVRYLSEHHGLNINALFFSVFGDGDKQFIGRSWLIDPQEVARSEARVARRAQGEWSGYWFVNVGEDPAVPSLRSWNDCLRYGFISGGDGERYRRAMAKLHPGDEIFAYIVQRGYVGYGVVSADAVPAKDFVTTKGPLLDQQLEGKAVSENRDSLELAEYVVGVDWKKTYDRDHGQTYLGIFANQNIVCKIRDSATAAFLRERFEVAPLETVSA